MQKHSAELLNTAIGTTSVKVVFEHAMHKVYICNLHTTAILYMNPNGAEPAVSGKGIAIFPKTCFEYDEVVHFESGFSIISDTAATPNTITGIYE